MRRVPLVLLQAIVILFFVAFFVTPIVQVLRGGVTDTEGRLTVVYLREVFRNPLYLEGLLNSLLIAVCTTSVCLLIAVPLAWLADRFEFVGKRILVAGLLLPLILPPFVGALGMQRVFGQYGALNAGLAAVGFLAPEQAVDWLGGGGFLGIVLVEALHLFPVLYLNAVAAFANVDPLLHEAAANLGCVGSQRFRRITLPLVLPGIFAGSAIVFIWSFTELGTPLMFNFDRVTSVQIFHGINEIGDSSMPYALVMVMMAAAALMYVLVRVGFGRRGYAMMSKATVASHQVRLRGGASLGVAAIFSSLVLLALLPHLGVLGIAVGKCWYRTVAPTGLTLEHAAAALGHNLTVPSILNSVRYASVATAVALLVGVLIAFLVVRSRVRFAWLLDGLAMMPLAVPGLVLAFGYVAMSQKGRFFHFLNPIEDPTVLLIVAYAVRRLPYVVRAAVAGLQQTSEGFEEAAANLGATPWVSFRRITAPLIAANLIAGGILAFSFSMLEVSDSLILAQKSAFFPITKAIYELSMLLGQGQALAAALGLWTMVFLGTSLLVASCLLGRRLGALFRV
jgi:iron(III) transport system permease protein